MNSDLYNRTAKLPESLIKHLNDSFSTINVDSNVEGFKRNKELRETGTATYQQIKRIKNWFDGYSGDKKDAPFILNGGDRMKKWCDEVLRVWRDGDKSGKEIKSDTGMMNQHIDSHEKNSFNLNDKHNSTSDSLKVEGEIERINKLIKGL
jgi:hypothetical protein